MSTKTKTDSKDRFVIIMAGGRGERFWPLSREKTPKQLLAILGKKSFLQEAVERVLPLVPAKNIFIITNEVQAPEVRKQLPKLSESFSREDRDEKSGASLQGDWLPHRLYWQDALRPDRVVSV